jgi:hypothetical protein
LRRCGELRSRRPLRLCIPRRPHRMYSAGWRPSAQSGPCRSARREARRTRRASQEQCARCSRRKRPRSHNGLYCVHEPGTLLLAILYNRAPPESGILDHSMIPLFVEGTMNVAQASRDHYRPNGSHRPGYGFLLRIRSAYRSYLGAGAELKQTPRRHGPVFANSRATNVCFWHLTDINAGSSHVCS